jgi:hypothetical protein
MKSTVLAEKPEVFKTVEPVKKIGFRDRAGMP